METWKLRKSLLALSNQQGHYGTINVDDVVTIIELRDEKLKGLAEELNCLTSQSQKSEEE